MHYLFGSDLTTSHAVPINSLLTILEYAKPSDFHISIQPRQLFRHFSCIKFIFTAFIFGLIVQTICWLSGINKDDPFAGFPFISIIYLALVLRYSWAAPGILMTGFQNSSGVHTHSMRSMLYLGGSGGMPPQENFEN